MAARQCKSTLNKDMRELLKKTEHNYRTLVANHFNLILGNDNNSVQYWKQLERDIEDKYFQHYLLLDGDTPTPTTQGSSPSENGAYVEEVDEKIEQKRSQYMNNLREQLQDRIVDVLKRACTLIGIELKPGVLDNLQNGQLSAESINQVLLLLTVFT